MKKTVLCGLFCALCCAAAAFGGRGKVPVKHQVIPPNISVQVAAGGEGIEFVADRTYDEVSYDLVPIDPNAPIMVSVGYRFAGDTAVEYGPAFDAAEMAMDHGFSVIDGTGGVIITNAAVSNVVFTDY